MARSNAVWGIDIGNCSLKAMRCYVEDSAPSMLVVDAVDYIEYPQILTQPGVEPEEQIKDALKLFLSRNKIKGDKIAVAVGGQNGLVRFLKLPPIEPKRIPDIVKYEAKQQIAFLDEVIWKWQRMGQQGTDSAFPLEVEIGLFAVKREQIFKTVAQCDSLGIPIDSIQLTPISLYNYLMHDEMHDLPSLDDYDPENPPPYVVVLAMGTDATDLILTNGFRAWQRNLPIGGNNFTKALMKELKLTFAKADHLKRNLATSQDKVAVLRAMQPVFNSFQNEIQRSLGFFSSLDPNAQYDRVIALGNAMKLTGLTKYLSQSFGIEVKLGNSFPSLDTSNLADSSVITENMSTFGTCYGLCLQGLKQGSVNTNFLPGEITLARLINSKKPWMLAGTALLMLGSVINFGAQMSVQDSVQEKNWRQYESQAENLTSQAKGFADAVTAEEGKFEALNTIGLNFFQDFKSRTNWIDLLYGLNQCLPVTAPPDKDMLTPEEVMAREELHIVNVEAQPLTDFEAEEWMKKALQIDSSILPKKLAKQYKRLQSADEDEEGGEEDGGIDEIVKLALAPEPIPGLGGDSEDGEDGEEAAMAEEESEDEEDGDGSEVFKPKRWVVSVYGYHWHNAANDKVKTGAFVRQNFINKLSGELECRFKLPIQQSALAIDPNTVETEEVTMKDLGVRYPILMNASLRTLYGESWNDTRPKALIRDEYQSAAEQLGLANARLQANAGMAGMNPDGTEMPLVQQRTGIRYDFVVHFLWEPKSATDRADIRALLQKAEEERLKAEAEADEMSSDEEDEDMENEDAESADVENEDANEEDAESEEGDESEE